ncbi:hypothetical protein HK099_004171 [Clydaea vesicula]|uniref:Protein unc-45 homolog B n=1 Tax=Clydaea vesicula TaxID=447962 RepID=A0AAD5U710_9FUNG|nr:hypothetical protein HK099_004171 [Clydaea vesicula]
MLNIDADLDPEILKLTKDLETLEVNPETLLKRAAKYKNLNKFDKALNDVKTALSLDKSNLEAKNFMFSLLKETQQLKEVEASKNSVKSLLETISIENAPLEDRVESARKLLYLINQNEVEVSRNITQSGGITPLINSYMKDLESNGISEACFQNCLLTIILLSSKHNELNLKDFLTTLNRSNLNLLFFGSSEKKENFVYSIASTKHFKMVIEVLSLLCNFKFFNLPTNETTLLMNVQGIILENCLHVIKLIFKNKKSEELTNDSQDLELKKITLSGLMKILSQRSVCLNFIESKDLNFVLSLSKIEPVKNLIPLVLSRLFEQFESEENGNKILEGRLSSILNSWYKAGNSQDTSTALLALSAIFQAKPLVGSKILQSPGMIEEIADALEFAKEAVQLATLEALTSSCTDKSCRTLILTHLEVVLKNLSKSNSNALKTLASSILIKASTDNIAMQKHILENENALKNFIESVIKNASNSNKSERFLSSIESLAYLSIHTQIKEKLCFDKRFLESIFSLSSQNDNTLRYGIAMILTNISAYKKRLSGEEEQVKKLRELAKDKEVEIEDPKNSDKFVEKRCEFLTKSGVVTCLVKLSKTTSTNIKDIVAQIFLNLTTNKANRGLVVQQGGVRTLLNLSKECSSEFIPIAAQSLAKIVITTDPNVAFKGELKIELIKPLLDLCNGNDQLQQFEGTMGLTNLASTEDRIREIIVSLKGLQTFEMLQFSDNEMIQRAATEMICNMLFNEKVFKHYSERSDSQKLKIFIALSDSENFETQRAASGCLAILSSNEYCCRFIGESEKNIEIIIRLCEVGVNFELVHRGVEILKNFCYYEDLGKKLLKLGVVDLFRRLMKCEVKEIAVIAIEGITLLKERFATAPSLTK